MPIVLSVVTNTANQCVISSDKYYQVCIESWSGWCSDEIKQRADRSEIRYTFVGFTIVTISDISAVRMINLSPMVITLHLVKEDTAFPRGGRGDKVFVQQTQDV